MPATCRLLLSPPATGKTAYAVDLGRAAARAGALAASPHVIVKSYWQAQAFRARLARAGGALGVWVGTFDEFYQECLAATNRPYQRITDPVEYRLVRAELDRAALDFFAALRRSPGLSQSLQMLFRELTAAGVSPEQFAAAVAGLDPDARLQEIAALYVGCQGRVAEMGWTSHAGMGQLALAALREAPRAAAAWGTVAVDGFSRFSPVELALLAEVRRQVGQLVVLLDAPRPGQRSTQVHRRLDDTRRLLEGALVVAAEPLPRAQTAAAAPLRHLGDNLFEKSTRCEQAGELTLFSAVDRVGEVRAALRWLRERMRRDGMQPQELALLARSVLPYRPFILEAAAEYGLPLRLASGLPLRTNPAVAALLNLMRLAQPLPDQPAELAVPPGLVAEAWRSPYFDWSAQADADDPAAVPIDQRSTLALAEVARWGRVLGGTRQWVEMLDRLAARDDTGADRAELDDERGVPPTVPVGEAARQLKATFERFTRRLTPPAGRRSWRDFVAWLEDLIGVDPVQAGRFPVAEDVASLRVVARVRNNARELAERDIAALSAFKDVLRGLVWAERSLALPPVDFAGFLAELTGALEAASYSPSAARDGILVASVEQARGLSFRAVAVLGLAEGEFPAIVREDPFLPDADRTRLRASGLPLDLSLESNEAELFWEAVTRPRERLLLTRPRLADNGAPWETSPYWEEAGQLVAAAEEKVVEGSGLPPGAAASWPELLECLGGRIDLPPIAAQLAARTPRRLADLQAATGLLRERVRGDGAVPYDGDLTSAGGELARRFGPTYGWSTTRLEKHGLCGFYGFLANGLALEPREEPSAGLDVRQLGSIYHRILEQLYASAADPADVACLLAGLPAVAGRVLDLAPAREGFRPNAWWEQTRREIVATLERSIEVLEALSQAEGWVIELPPERSFRETPLTVVDGDDSFRLRGVIDRVDRTPDGRRRVIDYKSGGPSEYKGRALEQGKKVQLAAYALAVRDVFGGELPAEGFYWHLAQAEASPLTLRGYPGGADGAVEVGVAAMWRAVRAARRGEFTAAAPDGGCPDYCPGATFCWHYRPRFRD